MLQTSPYGNFWEFLKCNFLQVKCPSCQCNVYKN